MIDTLSLKAETGSTDADAAKYIGGINEAMDRFEINTNDRIAAFLATVAVESMHLAAVEEGLYYSDPARLALIFPRVFPTPASAIPFARNPSALSMKLYNGFHGRGLIQLTWQANYKACGDALGVDFFVSNPEALCTPRYAALSAGWFWQTHGCNEIADTEDMETITAHVNGPAKLALAQRQADFEASLAFEHQQDESRA